MSVKTPPWLLNWLLYCYLILHRPSATKSNQTLPLPPDWDVYCPYTDFCTHPASLTVNLTAKQRPCCDPCSCEPECGLKRNCCTYSMDKYHLDEQDHITCTLLSTVNNFASIRFTNYYLTVDKCPNQTSCYDFKSAPWGSMYPVASRTTGMIYLNEKCAGCNCETDFQKLKIEVNCLMISAPTNFVSDGVKSAFLTQEDQTNAGCFIHFLPPSKNATPMKCTSFETINSCRSDSNASSEIQTLCRSFNSTFMTDIDSPYANVYCRICNRKLWEKQELEQICPILEAGRTMDVPFSFILDIDDISDLEKQDTNAGPNNEQLCAHGMLMEHETRKCRRFHCPEGQMMLGDRCSFLGREWTAGPFVAYLRLEPVTPRDRFPSRLTHQLSSHRGKFFKTALNAWERKLFYREVPEAEMFVPYFVLELVHEKATISAQKFINDFQKSLKTIWTVRFSGKMYNFRVRLHTYSRYVRENPLGTRITPLIINQTPDQTYKREVLLSVKQSKFPQIFTHIPFTKAFLCKKVDLLPEEFVDRGTSLYLKLSDRSLGIAEYWKSPADKDRNETVSVCADDLGPNFWYIGSSACTCIFPQSVRVTILACALIAFLAE